MEEKKNLLSKLNIKDYKKDLELVLENKQFDEEAKSLLLSVFYKLDNFYKDYILVKKQVESKNSFLEKYIELIDKKCNKISILSPKDFTKNKKFFIDRDKREIKCFPSETILLYTIYKLGEDYLNISDCKTNQFTSICINDVFVKGNTINSIEPIRDFTGWSWNIDITNSENIMYNLIFQNILILYGYEFTKNNINNPNLMEELKEFVVRENLNQSGHEFLNSLFELCIILYSNYTKENHLRCYKYKILIEKKYNKLNDKKKYVSDKSKNNSNIIKKIQRIDRILNDVNLTKKAYEYNISKNPNKWFGVGDFINTLEKEKEKLTQKMEDNNKSLSPKEFIKICEEYQNIIKMYDVIKKDYSKVNTQSMLQKLQKDFMICLKSRIENMENKRDLYNLTNEFRYYSNLPYNTNKIISKVDKLKADYEEVSKKLIYKLVQQRVIDIGFRTKKLNYDILKYIFKTKIIKLDNLAVKIEFLEGKKVKVEYYDSKVLEYTEVFDIPFEEEITTTKTRKIKLFKIGG